MTDRRLLMTVAVALLTALAACGSPEGDGEQAAQIGSTPAASAPTNGGDQQASGIVEVENYQFHPQQIHVDAGRR
jgi:predicted component of type VI protein secretion system